MRYLPYYLIVLGVLVAAGIAAFGVVVLMLDRIVPDGVMQVISSLP